MWRKINGTTVINLERYSIMIRDQNSEGQYIIAFYQSDKEWSEDCPHYLSSAIEWYDTADERDLAYNDLLAELGAI